MQRIHEIYNQLKKSYRLSVTERVTFIEVFSISVSKLKVYGAVILLVFSGFLLALLLLYFTPLKKTIPGYPTKKVREMIVRNTLAVDSLVLEIKKRDEFLAKIKAVISGEIIDDSSASTVVDEGAVALKPMHNDTIFNELIATEHGKGPYLGDKNDIVENDKFNFYTPFYGLITNKYDALPGHFGTDIVGRLNAPVSSIYDGVVIFAEWSVTTGYVVIVQHSSNLISVYKHNSEIIAKLGEKVKKGEMIALMGGEGEYSTGPHLHFEMWQNGVPLDPENYFDFRK
jgi:murein DD-endopeptidase MepM/ murein hydrolase activator NlpD